MSAEAEELARSSSSADVDQAYRFCRKIAHEHGANFSVGFRFLPPAKRRAVYAAYAFCRWTDDIADSPGENVAERLSEWQRELDRCYEGRPAQTITVALADALGHFDIPKSAFIALIDGCKQDLVKSRYATFDELLSYCDLVATSISDISLSIFGYRDDSALWSGRSLSTALQLTNIARDVGDDLSRDRIYIPAEELEQFGVSEADLVARKKSREFVNLMTFQIARARSYFVAAEPLLSQLSFEARFPTLLMGGIYAEILTRLGKNPALVLDQRLSLSPAAKAGVVLSRLVRPRFL